MGNHDDAHGPYEGGISRRGFLQASAAGLATGTLAGSGLAGTALAEDFDRRHRHPPRGRRVLIKGGVVLTMDPAIGDFEQADVLIDGSRIVSVRPNIRASAQVIDARGMIVMPGFVNTHHHQYETIQRANNADGNLQWAGANPVWPQEGYGTVVQSIWTTGQIQIGNQVIWDLGRSPYDPEDNYISELVASISQIDQGVTTVCRHLTELALARAYGRHDRRADGLGRPRAVRLLRRPRRHPGLRVPGDDRRLDEGSRPAARAVVQLRRPARDLGPQRRSAGRLAARPRLRRGDRQSQQQRRHEHHPERGSARPGHRADPLRPVPAGGVSAVRRQGRSHLDRRRDRDADGTRHAAVPAVPRCRDPSQPQLRRRYQHDGGHVHPDALGVHAAARAAARPSARRRERTCRRC